MLMILFALALSAPIAALAAQTQTPFVPLVDNSPGGLTSYQTTGNGDLAGYLNALFRVALSVGAMAGVLRLVYAGYMYMGSDMWSSKGKAREIIGNVVLGLLLLLGIYLILFQINPQILNLNVLSLNSGTPQAAPAPQPTPETPAQILYEKSVGACASDPQCAPYMGGPGL